MSETSRVKLSLYFLNIVTVLLVLLFLVTVLPLQKMDLFKGTGGRESVRIWRKYNTQMVKDKMAKDKMAKDEAVQAKDEAVQASPKRKINTRGGSILNPAITPCISRALVKLADLTEYNKLGGEPGPLNQSGIFPS